MWDGWNHGRQVDKTKSNKKIVLLHLWDWMWAHCWSAPYCVCFLTLPVNYGQEQTLFPLGMQDFCLLKTVGLILQDEQ